MRTGFVDIPGVRLANDSAGVGLPIIFLHGGLLDRRLWDAQFTFFSKTHRAVRYDLRSSGESRLGEVRIPVLKLMGERDTRIFTQSAA
jgi:pimeloyl-ACP methyl ester carboxylesterase